jgi:hypothetical protein
MIKTSPDPLRVDRQARYLAANIADGEAARVVSIASQLRIYDSLPRDLRRLIDALPQKSDLGPLPALVAKYGPSWTREWIIEQMMKKYPGWTYQP